MKFTPSACKRLIIRLLRLVVKPITCQPAFFIFLFTLLCVPDTYSLLLLHSLIPLLKVFSGFFICYLLAFPVVFMPSKWSKCYKILLCIFASLFFVIDISLLLLYDESFGTISKDAIAAVLATNPDEVQEYFDSYFTADKLLIVLVLMSVLWIVFYYLRKLDLEFKNIGILCLLALLSVSVVITFAKLDKIEESNFYYLLTKDCPDLCEYKQNPNVVCTVDGVKNIVLVVGESFTKFQSSLYGYDKDTNPRLERLRKDSILFVYENITSAYVTTIPSIKSIMMSYVDSMCDSIEWYRCLTLLEIMQKSGYRTYWISNQSKTGIYDNEVGRFADLCDCQVFIGDKNSGLSRSTKDEGLLPVVEKCLSEDSLSKFVVVQMMGSYAAYVQRYPSSFAKFRGSDYDNTHSHLSPDKRQVIAEYDNSLLYNDSVACELMRMSEQDEVVVIYLSDHGEDVFRSSDDICGHSQGLNEYHTEVVQQIPFMVYTTRFFREKHPELQRRIESSVNRPYRTDSIMYTIMDVAGVESVNGVSYKHKSLFKKQVGYW